MTKILIIESRAYETLANNSLKIVMDAVKQNDCKVEVITVNNIFDSICAISLSIEIYDYDGIIVLGNVLIKNQDDFESKEIFKQLVRCLADFGMQYAIPIGFGVAALNDIDSTNSELKSAAAAKSALLSCLKLIRIKTQINLPIIDEFRKYNH